MFAWWSRLLVRLRWVVLAAAAVVFGIGATWGTGVFGALTGGGFNDPESESSDRAGTHRRGGGHAGRRPAGASTPARPPPSTTRLWPRPVTDRVAALRASPPWPRCQSWYDTGSPALVSQDRHATLVTVRLAESATRMASSRASARCGPCSPPPRSPPRSAGWSPSRPGGDADRARHRRAEVFSFPILLVLLVLIFRGVVAAVTPLLIGGLAILGRFHDHAAARRGHRRSRSSRSTSSR